MFRLEKAARSSSEITPACTSSLAIRPFGSGRSPNSHVIVGAFRIATQSTCAVVRPRSCAASYRVFARTISALSRHGSIRGATPGSRKRVPLNSTPCLAGLTPVTIDVWLGHVTVGFTGRMPFATTPRSASRRSVGTGREGSSSAQPPKPSSVMMTTWFEVVAGCVCGAESIGTDNAANSASHEHKRRTERLTVTSPLLFSGGVRLQADLCRLKHVLVTASASARRTR